MATPRHVDITLRGVVLVVAWADHPHTRLEKWRYDGRPRGNYGALQPA